MTKLGAGHFLQGLARHFHTKYQDGDSAQEFQYNQHIQNFSLQRYAYRLVRSSRKANYNRILTSLEGILTASKHPFLILRKNYSA